MAINDQTRPVPHDILLTELVRWLEGGGYRREDILFIVATGTHQTPDDAAIATIVPRELADIPLVSHDALREEDLVDLGQTSIGTPCLANRRFMEADLRIVVGNIEPHQFMGWSGGAKSAAIGLAGYPTITANHGLLGREGSGPCRYEENPIRQDVEELGRLMGVDLALNVVMNGSKEIVGVFAGDPVDVMRRGIALARSLFAVPAGGSADLVVVAPGGHPKDINFYQSQKAVRHVAPSAKAAAPIILAAACPDGVGHDVYHEWMRDKRSHRHVMEAFDREPFRLGPHKGKLVADDAEGRRVILVSELEDEVVRGLLLEPAESVQAAVDAWAAERSAAGLDAAPRVLIVPYGNATVPMV